jgi:RimJ/RimL family protein N-acetyltransferase
MFTFREIEKTDAQMILSWRTSNRVSKYMNTPVNHGVEDQEQWIISSRTRSDFYHWLIVFQEKPIGYISLNEFDREAKTTSWGFYIGEEEEAGLGGLVSPYFYNFCFDALGVKKVNAEILYFNTRVIELHLLHGYEFTPERDRLLTKKGKDILQVAMSLDKARFKKSKFARFQSEFPISYWQPKKETGKNKTISFEKITGTNEQIAALFKLLENRQYTISHDELTSLEQHTDFVQNHPYRNWWMVQSDGQNIGSVYLTNDNAVGINLQTEDSAIFQQVITQVLERNNPLPGDPSVRPDFFYTNVAPGNSALQNALANLGAKYTQKSFRIK